MTAKDRLRAELAKAHRLVKTTDETTCQLMIDCGALAVLEAITHLTEQASKLGRHAVTIKTSGLLRSLLDAFGG